MDFKVTRYEKIINILSDSTLQLDLRKYHLLSFGVVLKKKIHNYLNRLLKKVLPFPTAYVYGVGLSSHASTK